MTLLLLLILPSHFLSADMNTSNASEVEIWSGFNRTLQPLTLVSERQLYIARLVLASDLECTLYITVVSLILHYSTEEPSAGKLARDV